VAGSCGYGDEPSGSGATELVSVLLSHKFRSKYIRIIKYLKKLKLSYYAP
jgi:hypothetical protein